MITTSLVFVKNSFFFFQFYLQLSISSATTVVETRDFFGSLSSYIYLPKFSFCGDHVNCEMVYILHARTILSPCPEFPRRRGSLNFKRFCFAFLLITPTSSFGWVSVVQIKRDFANDVSVQQTNFEKEKRRKKFM